MKGRLRIEEGKEGRRALPVDTLPLAGTGPRARLCRYVSRVSFTCPLGIPPLAAHALALYMTFHMSIITLTGHCISAWDFHRGLWDTGLLCRKSSAPNFFIFLIKSQT